VFEGAELAGTYAFVGEVDVSVYNEGDLVSAASAAQGIGQAEEPQWLRPEPLKLIPAQVWIDQR
jgi:hypothetical protein